MPIRHEFLCAVQAYTARLSVGASTLRGQGAPGAVHASREFLAALELRPFAVSRPRTFYPRLDDATLDLRRALPGQARSWGAARKVLNIFLRNALYNGYLRDHYGLEAAESLYEVPLDSIVASRLLVADGLRQLPRWPGVRHLTHDVSEEYQHVARLVARHARLAPVHLDTYWWGGDRSDADEVIGGWGGV